MDILISAQSHIKDFYSNLGFIQEGQSYLEDGIHHVKMRLVNMKRVSSMIIVAESNFFFFNIAISGNKSI